MASGLSAGCAPIGAWGRRPWDLKLDHLSAEVAQDLASKRPRDQGPHLDDQQVGERASIFDGGGGHGVWGARDEVPREKRCGVSLSMTVWMKAGEGGRLTARGVRRWL